MTTPKAQHSELPWELSDCDPYRIQSQCDGDLIVSTRFSHEKPIPTRKADADIIVKAVNCHAKLLEALRGMLGNYLELKRILLAVAKSDAPNWIGAGLEENDDVHVIAARAAIAAATGGEG